MNAQAHYKISSRQIRWILRRAEILFKNFTADTSGEEFPSLRQPTHYQIRSNRSKRHQHYRPIWH